MYKRSKNSLVSIVVPVFNASDYLVATLDSILKQTHSDFELICVDDASTDDSYLILKQYAAMDSRIKVYKNAYNKGVSKTANFAISKAKSNFIARIDADDLMYETRIQKQVNFLIKNPSVVVVGGQVKLIDRKGRFIGNKNFPINHKEIYNVMYTAMSLQQGAMMVNTNLLPKNFDWYNGVRTAEEVKLFFRLFKYGKFANLPDYVLKYRQYGESTSLKNAKKTFKITYRTRKRAVKDYGYKPTFKAKVVNELQNIVITLLPSKLIYPLFLRTRKILVGKNKIIAKRKVKSALKIAQVPAFIKY